MIGLRAIALALSLQGVVQPDAAALQSATAAAQADAATAKANAAAALAALNGKADAAALSGFVKSVSSIGPDGTGNVAGVATTAMVQTAIVDVIQMASGPATGATVQASAGTTVLFVNNTSLLLALTVGMPPSPIDGQRFTVCTNAAITTMGFTGGTIKGALGSFSASGYARFIYSATLGAWFRAG